MISIPLSPAVVVLGGLIAQGLFAAVILGMSRKNQPANRFLALLLLSFSLWLIDSFYRVAGVYEQDPDYYFLPIFYSFAFGPLLYFYVRALTVPDFRFRSAWLLHFVPVLLQAGLYWTLTFQDYSTRRWFWFEIHQPVTYFLEFVLTLLLLAGYTLLSIRLLIRYQRWLADQFSEFTRIRLQWLRLMLTAMGLLCVLWTVDVYFYLVVEVYYAHSLSEVIMGLLVLVLAVGSLRQNSIDRAGFEKEEATRPAAPVQVDATLLRRIRQRMDRNKDFLNPTLTLQEFAGSLKEPPRTVSEHINHGLEMTFVDFVNGYRIEEVKRHIAAGRLDQHTLLAIALESGFNSKSTFNRVFKKREGMSPTAFVRLVHSTH